MGLVLLARVFYKHLLTPDLRKVLVDLNIHNRDLKIRGTGTTTSMRFELKLFRIFSIIDSRESFILPFFTRKFSTVISSEGGYTPSRSRNDKTSNILISCLC